MGQTSEPEMRRLASERLGPGINEAAAFRTVAPIPVNPSAAEVIGGLVRRAIAGRRSGVPVYPFLVLIGDDLVILDFRFGGTIEVVGTVRCPLASLHVINATPDERRISLRLPPRDSEVVLEGLFGSPAERNLIVLLQARKASF